MPRIPEGVRLLTGWQQAEYRLTNINLAACSPPVSRQLWWGFWEDYPKVRFPRANGRAAATRITRTPTASRQHYSLIGA